MAAKYFLRHKLPFQQPYHWKSRKDREKREEAG
jgi:hypothetical protein